MEWLEQLGASQAAWTVAIVTCQSDVSWQDWREDSLGRVLKLRQTSGTQAGGVTLQQWL